MPLLVRSDTAQTVPPDDPPFATDLTSVRGVFLGAGATCPQFLSENGEQISLSGDLPALEQGARYVISGRITPFSKCQQGREMRVSDVTPAPAND